MCAYRQVDQSAPREGYLSAGNAGLYYRERGQGEPIFVLHGGPDFDHTYLLPDLDRLSETFRLIYYDQRGRGKSGDTVRPEDVTIQSEIVDLESLRDHFQLDSIAVLGHSWGGVLAMEYAIRHPDRVSHVILMNTGPASHDDYLLFRQALGHARADGDAEKMQALALSPTYQMGDPDAVAAYYRVHFHAAIRHPVDLESIVSRLRASSTPEGVLRAREIEKRLMNETWLSSSYNLLPALERLRIPTLVVHGEEDFIPVGCAAHIADAIPGARFVVLPACGHFSYLECPDELHEAVSQLFHAR